ncbi:MAG: hypothetical protein ACHQNA_11615 [Acidimicrobiales bacterium]
MRFGRAKHRDQVTPPAQPLRCATCGRELGHDREDEPRGDAGLPICGNCNRARNFDVLFGDGERR